MATRVTLGPRRNVSVSTDTLGAVGGMVRPNVRRWSYICANGAGGFNSVGENGTVVATAATTLSPSASLPWTLTDLATAATLNSQGYTHGSTIHLWGRKPRFQAALAPGSVITVARFWLGYSSVSFATLLGVDTPGTSGYSGAAFRFSTAAGDTNYQCVTFAGVSQTVTDSGIAVVASAPRKFEISDDGTNTTFKIDGNVVATNSANRPAATTNVRQGGGVQTLEAVIKSASVGWLYTETE